MIKFSKDFWTENGRDLIKPDLICLRQDASTYRTLLFQVKGKIAYNDQGIYIEDKSLAEEKFSKFLGLANKSDAELVITPEYSCPWSIIEKSIVENILPKEGKIWILGCQSIKAQELNSLIKKHTNITWIYENELVEHNRANNKFFDPVCICFTTKDTSGMQKTVIIVQFKNTFFSGGDYKWERENLILGETFYIIGNNIASTRLVVLICSDTLQNLNFNEIDNSYFLNLPLLLIHIQLNHSPLDGTYKNYRNFIFEKNSVHAHNKEIITLNWARKVTYDGEKLNTIFNYYSGSAFYLKTAKLDTDDERINNNHKLGLYYTYWREKRSHIYMLNYDEFVFLIENTKPSQIASHPGQIERTGPKALETFTWQNSLWLPATNISDGFIKFCSEIQKEFGDLSCITNNETPLNVERLIELSTGNINVYDKNWYKITNLTSFRVDSDEICKRTNFTHDPDCDANNNRYKKIVTYAELKHTIIKKPECLPKFISNVSLRYDDEISIPYKYLLNLHSKKNKISGAGVFLGNTTKIKALTFRNNFINMFEHDQTGKITIVWYFQSGTIHNIYELEPKPDIGENTSKPNNAINSTNK